MSSLIFNEEEIQIQNKFIKLDYHEKYLIFLPEITNKIIESACPNK